MTDHAAEWEKVIGTDGKWNGLIMMPEEKAPDCEVWLHGNGAKTADGAEVVKQAFTFGESQALAKNPFTRAGIIPEDISGEFLGWSVGKADFDWQTDGEESLLKDGDAVTLREVDFEEWKRLGWATEENKVPVLHLHAVWQSTATVEFFNTAMGEPLAPSGLADHVFFAFAPDATWRKGGEEVKLSPGDHPLLVKWDSEYKAYVESWDVVDVAGNVISDDSEPYFYPFRIDAAEGPVRYEFIVKLTAKEAETGSVWFHCTGKLTDKQKSAWPEFPEFEEGKVEITLTPTTGNGGSVSVAAGVPETVLAGVYKATIGYKEKEAGGQPYWGGPNRETITKEIEIKAGQISDVAVSFLPFGSSEADYYWIAFDGNGGTGTENVLLWFGRWHDTGGYSLNSWVLPMPEMEGWTFTGWRTPGGKAIKDGKALENWLRSVPLANVTLKAGWVAVPKAWLEANAGEVLAENGGDYEAASVATAGNGMAMWECYVAGVDPADKEASFKAKLVEAEGKRKVEPVGGKKEGRVYRVEGKKVMTDDEWEDVTGVEDWEGDGWRFFRLGVELEE